MIPHTNAFKALKTEAQRVFDFAIVVTYAVPALKAALKGMESGAALPFSPDHFDGTKIPTAKVAFHAKEYKELLSRYIFLSSFSFFEAYFHDVIKEIVAFHGDSKLLERASLAPNLSLVDADAVRSKRKLQQYPTISDRDCYFSHGKKLAAKGFRFPSTLLARAGLTKVIELASGDYIKAADIPKHVMDLLQMPLAEAQIKEFNGYRNQRNKIAHGRASASSLHLTKAVAANNFLRNLALEIDRHVLDHYLVIEAF